MTTPPFSATCDLSRELLRKFVYRGLVAVEFKHDARDGTYRLMEINPRTVSGNQLAIRAGVDFPWIVYQYLVYPGACPPVNGFRPGVKHVNESWDLLAYRARRKDGDLPFWTWLRSLAGTQAWAIVSTATRSRSSHYSVRTRTASNPD